MLTFGTLGAADITPEALVKPAADQPGVAITHIAARDRKRAESFAATHAIPEILDDYAAVIAAPVDAIYIPLPPAEHAHWAIQALQAGKHVLCEKPFALSAAEASSMVKAAVDADRVLMEAFHYRYHPLFKRVLEIVTSGVLGSLQSLDASFVVPVPDRSNFRWQPGLGNGAMMDLGCYPLHWVRTVTGEEPVVRRAHAEADAQGTDAAMTAELEFADGVPARIHCDMRNDVRFHAELSVNGRDGRLRVQNPLAPHLGHLLTLDKPAGTTTETVAGQTTYAHQLESFRAACTGKAGACPTSGHDSIANMRAIDAIYTAAGLPPRGASRKDSTSGAIPAKE
jgi:predicted dehydrogenase